MKSFLIIGLGSFGHHLCHALAQQRCEIMVVDKVSEALEEGVLAFGKKIPGFDREDALLSGVESRTSSPVRILRDKSLQANYTGIYPCGEGAGYAGGITSAAMDGIKIAEKICEKYRNF